VAEDLSVGQDNSPTLSFGENSVDRPLVPQFVTAKQFGEALSQVEEVVIRGVCENMKGLECKPGAMWGFEYKPILGYTPLYQ